MSRSTSGRHRERNYSDGSDDEKSRPQTNLFPENLDRPDYFELNGKKYYAYMDIELVSKAFSKHFSENAQMPNYYINQIRKNGVWDEIEMEDPVTNVRDFLPHSRYPDFIKFKYFFKAQRAYHDVMCCQIFSHFLLCRLNELHFQQDPLEKIFLQYVTVKDHSTPVLENEERYVVPRKHRVCCLFLRTVGGKEFYLDLCGPQIDMYQLSNGRSGYPYLLFRLTQEGEKRRPMKVGEPYCAEQNGNVKIVEVEDLIPIENENKYKEYLQKLVEGGACEDEECQHENCQQGLVNNYLLGEDEELLVEYHERVSKEFKDRISKYMTKIRTRVKKQLQKAKKLAEKAEAEKKESEGEVVGVEN